ncbi:MAG: SAM-dependent methyltransferase [Pseudonocardiaceae bacterium]
MDDISYTAQWTAAARCLETERGGGGLFEDTHARELAGPRGFELLERYQGAGVAEYIAIRTRYMDDAVSTVLAGDPIDQVVLVACGMDTRSYRLRWPDRVTVYELDHSALLAEKHARLDRLQASAAVDVVEVGADLADDWLPALRGHGFDSSKPGLWVAEGLLFFLTEDQAGALLDTMAAASARGSRLTVDLTSATLLRHPLTQGFLGALRADGTPWRFGTDDPITFLRDHGWAVEDLKQPGEPGAGEGRWPYGVYPAEVSGVPRNWLVGATVQP